MGEFFGVALWPGVSGFLSCTYTNGHGISPGVASLVVPFQTDPIPPFGTLTLRDGINPPVVIPDCKVVSATVVAAPGGAKALALTIHDRRWRWKYGSVSGWYNQADPDPDLDGLPQGFFAARNSPFVPGTERTPGELLDTLLEAMGEPAGGGNGGSKVEGYPWPADARPPCDWSSANPAASLQGVADDLELRVCYQPAAGDRVLVTTRGGEKSPSVRADWPILEDNPGVLPAQPPDGWAVAGGPVWGTMAVPLEAVGREPNGQWVPIDQLSYKPKDGWGAYMPGGHWLYVQRGNWKTLEEAKKAAREYVWHAYRFKVDEKTPLDFPYGGVKVTHRRQLVPGGRIYLPEKDAKGQYRTAEPYVTGNAVARSGYDTPGFKVANDEPGTVLREAFAVDADRGLVLFGDPMYRDENGSSRRVAKVPDLTLVTSFHVRVPGTNHLLRYEARDRAANGLKKAFLLLPRPELQAVVVKVDDAVLGTVQADNLDEVDKAAAYYIDASKLKFKLSGGVSTTRVYGGVWPADPDAVVEQVTWSVGGGRPATTTVSANTEHAYWLPNYAERRRNEKADHLPPANARVVG